MAFKSLPFPEACLLNVRSMELTRTSALTQFSH